MWSGAAKIALEYTAATLSTISDQMDEAIQV